MALAKKNRLNLRLHRQRVEANCKKLHSALFTYLITPQPEEEKLSQPRFAILVSQKLAKKAVDRNKIKRRISQSIQDSLALFPQNQDTVLIPKKEILSKTIPQISKDINHVLHI